MALQNSIFETKCCPCLLQMFTANTWTATFLGVSVLHDCRNLHQPASGFWLHANRQVLHLSVFLVILSSLKTDVSGRCRSWHTSPENVCKRKRRLHLVHDGWVYRQPLLLVSSDTLESCRTNRARWQFSYNNNLLLSWSILLEKASLCHRNKFACLSLLSYRKRFLRRIEWFLCRLCLLISCRQNALNVGEFLLVVLQRSTRSTSTFK